MKKNPYSIALTILFSIIIIACNKKFDEPPPYHGLDIKANLSIRELRNMHFPGNFEKILDEYTIEGTIIADDKKDNFYKSIVVQDSTAGITVRLDGFGLHNSYPVGMKLYIKLKELWLGDYGKMLQLGAGVDRSDPNFPELIAIPQPLFNRYLSRGGILNAVVPKTVRLDELNDSLQSCLVIIADVEIPPTDTGRPFADVVNKLSVNHSIRSCKGGSVVLRTSGFASFANLKTPRGNGSITAVYSVFRTEKQLLIRDTSDLQLNGLRCTGTGAKLLLYEDFEAIATSADLAVTAWKNIAETGAKHWQGKMANNNKYAEINAFATNQPMLVSWLILPAVNLSNSANEVLSFLTRDGFDNGGVLQVYLSTNYDGGFTPWKAKWVPLKAIISKGSVTGIRSDWVPSGKISLAGFPGMVHIAFRYDGADPGSIFDKRTTSFQLDNVKIEGN